jgi:hypothetical protein
VKGPSTQGLSDRKFAKLPPWNWNSRVYKPARSIACSFLRQAEIHATISSEQNPRFVRERGRERTGFGTLGGQPEAKGEILT